MTRILVAMRLFSCLLTDMGLEGESPPPGLWTYERFPFLQVRRDTDE